jgi:hypothetical protein
MNSVSAAVIGCILVVATAMLVMPMALVHPLLVAEPTSKLKSEAILNRCSAIK